MHSKILHSAALLSFGLFSLSQAHFVLQVPTSLGFDDDNETIAPCGGFNASTRTNVTDWPIKGDPIEILTVHPSVTWEYKAARLCNLSDWHSLTPVLNQTGVGYFCEPEIPGLRAWLWEPAVLQVIQHGPDGDLYQCAAIRFVPGGPGAVPDACTNTTGVASFWL